MQPVIITVDGEDFRFFSQQNVIHPAAGIETFALRRVVGLLENEPKIIDFQDLPGFWQVDSFYISSPQDSEIKVEILDSNNVTFFEDKFKRHETPKSLPTVLINSNIKFKLTAYVNPIALLLIYLKPAYLAYSKDF